MIKIKIKNNPQPTTYNQHPRSYERGYHLTTQLSHLQPFGAGYAGLGNDSNN